jgi:hypothetical protein
MLFLNPSPWRRLAAALLSALLWVGGPSLSAKTTIPKEYQIKAVFLFNFAQFVKWPPAAFARANQPFCIGVLGDDPFDSFLEETVKGEKVNGHPLAVRRYGRVEDVKDCQILFISRSESQRIEKIIAGLKGKNILTVGDVEGFIQKGGAIRFFTEKRKIRFKINPEVTKRVNLSISSKMLRLAEIAEPGKD